MQLSATYEPSDEPHYRDVCTCGHLRGAHHGAGVCLAALVKSPGARGIVGQTSGCACMVFTPDGRRWVPPEDAELRELLRRHGGPRVDHVAGLIS